MVLGTGSAVQKIVLGRENQTADPATTAARRVATQIALSELNLTADPTSPSQGLTESVNLLAAAIFAKSDAQSKSYQEKGMALLKTVRGDSDDDKEWGRIDFF